MFRRPLDEFEEDFYYFPSHYDGPQPRSYYEKPW